MSWLSRLWQRWQRGGTVEPPTSPGELPEDDPLLTSPEAAQQLEPLPSDEQKDVLDRDESS